MYGALRRGHIPPPPGGQGDTGGHHTKFSLFLMTEALAIAVEQYGIWQRQGWTHREMLQAIERPYLYGTTGDDVVVEMVNAWNALDRSE